MKELQVGLGELEWTVGSLRWRSDMLRIERPPGAELDINSDRNKEYLRDLSDFMFRQPSNVLKQPGVLRGTSVKRVGAELRKLSRPHYVSTRTEVLSALEDTLLYCEGLLAAMLAEEPVKSKPAAPGSDSQSVHEGHPRVHVVKCWPEPFKDTATGRKSYEIRKDDRKYAVGDVLLLRKWSPTMKSYSGDCLTVSVTHKTPGGNFGLPEDVCVLGTARYSSEFQLPATGLDREEVRKVLEEVRVRLDSGDAFDETLRRARVALGFEQ